MEENKYGEFQEIYNFLKAGEYPEGCTKNIKRQIRKKAGRCFSIQGKKIYPW